MCIRDRNSIEQVNNESKFKVGNSLVDIGVNGFFNPVDGKIYINKLAGDINASKEQFMKDVVRHEMFHKGLKGINGKSANAILRDVFNSMSDTEKRGIANAYKGKNKGIVVNEDGTVDFDKTFHDNNTVGRNLIAEEYLAKRSENVSGFTRTAIGKRTYYKIKQMLRRIMNVSLSDNEIANLIVESRKSVPQALRAEYELEDMEKQLDYSLKSSVSNWFLNFSSLQEPVLRFFLQ